MIRKYNCIWEESKNNEVFAAVTDKCDSFHTANS